VLITSRKLWHYFQEYSISVFTEYPLGDTLRNQDATGRISKWAVELGALNINLKPRTAIKSQALVDFMAEWQENRLPTPTERPEHWVMYFDGSLKLEGAGAEVLLISPMGEQLKYVLYIFWKVSNNEAEYEALLHGLRLAASLGIKRLLVNGNSAVVISQVNKSWDRNKENMDAYCLEVRSSSTSSTVSSSTTSSATTMVQRTSCRSLVLLALKYQWVSSSTSFTRHPSRSWRHRPLTQRTPRLARRS
jgi:ribonuclease HI